MGQSQTVDVGRPVVPEIDKPRIPTTAKGQNGGEAVVKSPSWLQHPLASVLLLLATESASLVDLTEMRRSKTLVKSR